MKNVVHTVRVFGVVYQEVVMRTKWDVLIERQQKALEAYTKATRALEGLENTPCTCACPTCGTALYTEAEFARHFVIPDERYLNLGDCPHKTTI